jgi:fatty acid-binding protein DegV
MLKESIPGVKTYTCYIGPIIGASIGHDAIAVFAFGKEVTYTT